MSCISNSRMTKINFTMTSADAVASGVNDINTFYNQLIEIFNSNMINIPSGNYITLYNNTPNSISIQNSNEGMQLMMIILLFMQFGFSSSRICDVSIIPDSITNITKLNISFSINNIIPSPSSSPNDLSCECLGLWIQTFLQNNSALIIPGENILVISPPANILNNSVCQSNSFTPNIINNNNTTNLFKYIENNIEINNIKFTDISVTNNNHENFTDISVYSTPTITPSTIEHPKILQILGNNLFGYSYPIAFIGSLFYGICSIIFTNPASIVVNQNVTIFINIIIGVCGLIGLFNYFNNTMVPVIGTLFISDPSHIKINM